MAEELTQILGRRPKPLQELLEDPCRPSSGEYWPYTKTIPYFDPNSHISPHTRPVMSLWNKVGSCVAQESSRDTQCEHHTSYCHFWFLLLLDLFGFILILSFVFSLRGSSRLTNKYILTYLCAHKFQSLYQSVVQPNFHCEFYLVVRSLSTFILFWFSTWQFFILH